MTRREREQEMEAIMDTHNVPDCTVVNCDECRLYFFYLTDGPNDEDADEAEQEAWGI